MIPKSKLRIGVEVRFNIWDESMKGTIVGIAYGNAEYPREYEIKSHDFAVGKVYRIQQNDILEIINDK